MTSLALADPLHSVRLDRWRVHPDVGLLDRVALRIHWFSSKDDLYEAAKNSGLEVNEIDLLHGFSTLRRNATGEYVCDVYVVELTGAHTDSARTTTFGHEVLHCFGLGHQ
jgi:hypothetical protein